MARNRYSGMKGRCWSSSRRSSPRSEGPEPTHTSLWRFSGRLAGVLCKPPFAEFVEKIRIRCKRSLPDIYGRCGKLQPSGRILKQERSSPSQGRNRFKVWLLPQHMHQDRLTYEQLKGFQEKANAYARRECGGLTAISAEAYVAPTEFAPTRRFSLFTEVPVRWIQAQRFQQRHAGRLEPGAARDSPRDGSFAASKQAHRREPPSTHRHVASTTTR
jgi:hypothetical protein